MWQSSKQRQNTGIRRQSGRQIKLVGRASRRILDAFRGRRKGRVEPFSIWWEKVWRSLPLVFGLQVGGSGRRQPWPRRWSSPFHRPLLALFDFRGSAETRAVMKTIRSLLLVCIARAFAGGIRAQTESGGGWKQKMRTMEGSKAGGPCPIDGACAGQIGFPDAAGTTKPHRSGSGRPSRRPPSAGARSDLRRSAGHAHLGRGRRRGWAFAKLRISARR